MIGSVLAAKIIPYYMIPYGVGALLFAPLATKIPVKTLMVVTMFLFALTNYLCGRVTAINDFLILRLIMGVVSAGVVPLSLILIGKIFEQEVRGRLVGLFFSCSFVASITGIALSGLASWRWLFFLPAALGFLTAIFIAVFRSDLLGKIGGRVNYLKVFTNAEIRNILIFITLISTLYHGVDRWLGVYMHEAYHLRQLTISLLFGLIAVSAAVGQNVGGHLTDKKGRLFSCRLGIYMLAGAAMLLSVHVPIAALAGILVLLAMGWTIGHNGVSTVLTDFPDENRSEIASLNSSLRFVGGGLGFSVSGIFVQKSFEMTFLGIGVLILLLSFFLKKIVSS